MGHTHKYICSNVSDSIPEYQKGYKETYWVQPLDVAVIRIRWAMSHMSNYEFRAAQTDSSIPFFTVPENQLLEYPGFLYHCHILTHEDHEMMRPIMMRPHRSRNAVPWDVQYKLKNE